MVKRKLVTSKYFNGATSNEWLVVSMGLSFIAVLLLANLTKGEDIFHEQFALPVNLSQDHCDISIYFDVMSFSSNPLKVTLTSIYNETETRVLSTKPFVISLNDLKHFGTAEVLFINVDQSAMVGLGKSNGDVINMLSSSEAGTDYLLHIEEQLFGIIFGYSENTTVTVRRKGNNSIAYYHLDNGKTIILNPESSDVFQINSNKDIGLIYSSINLFELPECNYVFDMTWEMMYSGKDIGKEYLIYIPESENARIALLGYDPGLVTLYTMGDVKTIEIKALERLVIDAMETRSIFLSSNVDIYVITTFKLKGINSNVLLNNGPLQKSIKCRYFSAINCSTGVCGFIVSYGYNSSFYFYNSSGAIVKSFDKSNDSSNCSIRSLNITGLADDVYMVASNEPFELFSFDAFHGRFDQIRTPKTIDCDVFITTQAEKGISTDSQTSAFELSTINSTFSTSKLEKDSENTTDDNGPTTVDSVPKPGRLLYLTSNSSTNHSDSTVVQQIDNRLIFPFMYEEIPDDDSVLNTSLIAVIVSLVTAILAVIGVISTYLLLEILRRRRRQIGNTKIRPFVS